MYALEPNGFEYLLLLGCVGSKGSKSSKSTNTHTFPANDT